MDDGTNALTLAGYFAAHGMWSVADGDVRVPFIGSAELDGSRQLEVFEAEEYGAAVALAREAFRDAEPPAVLVYDGYANLPTGRTDALVLHVRIERSRVDLRIVLPYRSATHRDGFAVHHPRFEQSSAISLEEQGVWFVKGVQLHVEGARIWNEHLDETI
jgi:hypothetical protein